MRWSNDRYVAIKINAVDRPSKKTAENEIRISQLVSKANMQYTGRHFVRTLVDSFALIGKYGEHMCLVFEPLREPLWLVKDRFEENVIPSEILKIMAQMLLQGLDYLHTECHVIHTGRQDVFCSNTGACRRIHLIDVIDLKPDNVMVRLENESILERAARDELENQFPQKIYDDRTNYLSRNNYGQPASVTGIVCIIDFGHSVQGDVSNIGCIQAEIYRAPEVILEAGWTYSADIWSLGVMVISFLFGDSQV